MLSGEATNANFIVFGLNRSRFEPIIYCTGGEHANHYTTDVIHVSQRGPHMIYHYNKYEVYICLIVT